MRRSKPAGVREPGRARMLGSPRHDPYRSRRKLCEPTVCPDCGAVYHKGRWAWAEVPTDAEPHPCPACERIRDGYPAGYLILKGSFVEAHTEEIDGLIRNVEAREKGEHPLKRIMDLRTEQHARVVTTTDVHLARAIGDALHSAYEGSLDYEYSDAENLIRVTWSRE